MIGFVFADESEATSFYKKVINRAKHARASEIGLLLAYRRTRMHSQENGIILERSWPFNLWRLRVPLQPFEETKSRTSRQG
jgi:hypothetical protein